MSFSRASRSPTRCSIRRSVPRGVQDGQDGNLGFRWDSVPERFRDGRLRNDAEGITKSLYNGWTREPVSSKGGRYNLKMSDRVILQLSSRTLVECAS